MRPILLVLSAASILLAPWQSGSPNPAAAPAPLPKESDPLPKGASGRLGSVRLRHAGDIPVICFSPDGQTILALSTQAENAVYLWNATDGTQRRRISPEVPVTNAVYSPDGKRIAVTALLSGDNRRGVWGVLVWDATTGKELHRLEIPKSGQVRFSPDGKQLAILPMEGEVWLWQPGQKPRRYKGPKGWATALAFSPDGKRIVGDILEFGEDGLSEKFLLCVWDVESGKQTHTLPCRDHVTALAFSRDGKRLVSGGQGEDNAVRLWDLVTGKELPALPGRKGAAEAIWLAPDDKTLLVASGGPAAFRGWRLPAGTAIAGLPSLDRGSHDQGAMAFSPDGKRLAMGTWFGAAGQASTVKLWELDKGHRLLGRPGHEGEVRGLAFAADGKRLVSCGADGVFLWDIRQSRIVRRFGSREMSPSVIALSAGSLLAVSDERDERKIHLYQTAGGKELPALTWESPQFNGRPDRESIHWMRFSPDGRSLAAALDQRTLLWRLTVAGTRDGRPHSLADERRRFYPGGFSADGKTFTAGTWVGAIGWDVATGKEKSRVGKPLQLWGGRDGRFVSETVLSPDGKLLALGYNAGGLSLWDTAKAEEVSHLLPAAKDFGKGYRALAFSPDGKTLASGDRSGLIRFWDVATRKEIARREGHTGMILCLLFSPDGKTLASGGSDTTVLVWPVPGRKE